MSTGLKNCRNGHKMTARNTGKIKHTYNGKLYPYCKACKAKRYRDKYALDEEFRTRSLKRATTNYYRRKASHGLGQVP